MKTTLYCYTGTGNSLWAARKIAGLLDDAAIVPIARYSGERAVCQTQRIGLVFPVHIWGVPSPVIKFIQQLKTPPEAYFFAVAVNAGQVAATLIQLRKLLEKKQLHLASGFSLDLPSNYIVWRGAVSKEKQLKKFTAALKKMERIAAIVRNKEKLPPEKGPFWQNPFFSWTYRRSFPYVGKMDKSFLSDGKCNGCGICEKICPARNIRLVEGKPSWQHRCDQCFACIQWCPEEAIQYGKGTSRKKRYHHPDISLKDMLNLISPKGV